MGGEELQDFERWVANNSRGPVKPKTISMGQGAAMHLNSMRAIANGQPVISNAKLVGSKAKAVMEADGKVRQARLSGNNQTLLDSLSANPATGCAMVLSMASQASGYRPQDPGTAGNLNGFFAYVDQILRCPVFSPRIRDQIAPNLSGNWNSVIDSIVSYYPGLSTDQLNDIRTGLLTLARAASSQSSVNETQHLFVQSTLNADQNLTLYMYKSFINMRMDVHKGGKHSPDTVTNNASLQLWRTVLQFEVGLWPSFAPIIMHKTDASLESWLFDNTTPRGSKPINWNA